MNTVADDSQKQVISDDEIVRKVVAGEKHLYEIIMRRYNARLFRIGMSIVNNDADVEDIMQVAYIKAYEHLHKFDYRAGFGTWLTRILINESLLCLKKSKRFTSMEPGDENPLTGRTYRNENTPVKTLLNKELSNALEQALIQLPEKYRLVFVLREMENMSIAETVNTLNISESNVKVRLNRAKALLRDTLGNYYKNDTVYHFHLSRCDRIVNNVLSHLGIPTHG